MKHKVNVRDVALGAGIMLIGFAVGAIVTTPLIAQREGVFGEIQCSRLVVIDETGKPAITLATDTKEHGLPEKQNAVIVYNKSGEKVVVIGTHREHNGVDVHDKQGEPLAGLSDSKQGGMLKLLTMDSRNSRQPAILLLGGGPMGSSVMLFSPERHLGSHYYVLDETIGFILRGKDANDEIFLSVDEEGNRIRVLEAVEVKWETPRTRGDK